MSRVLALAVSGGADSLALMLLAHRWRQSLGCAAAPRSCSPSIMACGPKRRPRLRHGRPRLARLGLEHLPGAGGHRPAAGIRYRGGGAVARATACCRGRARGRRRPCSSTAHPRDDQAETLAAASWRAARRLWPRGDGAGQRREGIRIARPLLGLRRSALAAIVAGSGSRACPSIRTTTTGASPAPAPRALMPALAAGRARRADARPRTATRLRRAAAALDDYADRLLQAAGVDVTGAVRLDAARLAAEPEETRLAGPCPHPEGGRRRHLRSAPRASRTRRGHDRRRRNRAGAPLAGVIVERRTGEFASSARPAGTGCPRSRSPSASTVSGTAASPSRVRQMAAAAARGARRGRTALAGRLPADGLPRAIAACAALYRGDTLIAAPVSGWTPTRQANSRRNALDRAASTA